MFLWRNKINSTFGLEKSTLSGVMNYVNIVDSDQRTCLGGIFGDNSGIIFSSSP